MTTQTRFLALGLAIGVPAAMAHAGFTVVSGNFLAVGAPTTVTLGNDSTMPQSNDFGYGFQECANRTLTTAVATNLSAIGQIWDTTDVPGSIGAGTRVNSYFFHTDPSDSNSHLYRAVIRFDEAILGVICDRAKLRTSDPILGAVGTTYTDYDARGLETGGADQVVWRNAFEIEIIKFTTSTSTDDIRVVTVPEPATMAALGLGGLALIRRRKRA